MTYMATVGIHQKDGNRKVERRYSKGTGTGKFKTHISGKTHRMTVAKLAYQNEFGTASYGGPSPDILIKPRYVVRTRTVFRNRLDWINGKSVLTTLKHRQATNRYRNRSEQGYVIFSKEGKWVAYFKPGQSIKIPPRPFITKILTKPESSMIQNIQSQVYRAFMRNGLTTYKAMKNIAEIVQNKMKENVKKQPVLNSPVTQQAKGFNKPLYESENRLEKFISYKIYKNATVAGSKGNTSFNRQQIQKIDKILNSADKLMKPSDGFKNIYVYKDAKNFFKD